MKSKNKKIIGIKFCGGCNSGYDRTNAYRKIETGLSHKYEFVPHDNEDAEIVIVIVGCPTACVDFSPFLGKEILIVSEEAEVDELIDSLNSQS